MIHWVSMRRVSLRAHARLRGGKESASKEWPNYQNHEVNEWWWSTARIN